MNIYVFWIDTFFPHSPFPRRAAPYRMPLGYGGGGGGGVDVVLSLLGLSYEVCESGGWFLSLYTLKTGRSKIFE